MLVVGDLLRVVYLLAFMCELDFGCFYLIVWLWVWFALSLGDRCECWFALLV